MVCYNKCQRNFFYDHGCRDVIYGLHPKTLKEFWVFERDEKFNKVNEMWNELCKKNRSST